MFSVHDVLVCHVQKKTLADFRFQAKAWGHHPRLHVVFSRQVLACFLPWHLPLEQSPESLVREEIAQRGPLLSDGAVLFSRGPQARPARPEAGGAGDDADEAEDVVCLRREARVSFSRARGK